MNAEEDLKKKINIVQDKLEENGTKILSLLTEYQKFFSVEKKLYIGKIKKKCDERMSFLSKVEDENKRTMFKNTSNILDNLLKENEELTNNLNLSLNALKTFILKDPNIFQNENTPKNEDSKKKKLIIKSTDDCGKAKNIINSKEGINLEIIDINKITEDDFKYLFDDNLKKKEQEAEENYNEEEVIKIKKLKFKKSRLVNINFSEYFPNIENLNISDCKIGYNIYSKMNFNNIIRLSLEGIELVNENFEDLLIFLLKNKTQDSTPDFIGNNLKYLSVKNNRISRILFPLDVDSGNKKDIKNGFTNLTYLNLSGNNLFDFYIDGKKKPLFPSVKLLDLTNNNITSPLIIKNLITEKGEKCIILASKNLGVIKNNKMRKFYCDYLIKKLSKIKNEEYNIKSLDFEAIFQKKNKDILLKIVLNHFSQSLSELNLSFNNISDEDIITILENNKNLENLKRLNLSSNVISENFFAKFVENKFYENYKNLKLINLSCNPINFNEADIYKNFISSCQNLESLILKNTFISEEINQYLKLKIVRFTLEKKGQRLENLKSADKEMESLIDKDRFLNNNSKVYITVSYTVKDKYLVYVKKFFPYLLERIILEE